jgi:hypothetical protein
MNTRKIFCLLLAIAILIPAFGQAQVRKTGITGLAFLKVGVGARQVALGSAATSLRGDASMMFWNPAGIALSEGKTQFTFMYNKWIADLGHYAAGVTHDFGWLGTIGVGFIGFGKSGISAALARDPLDTETSETYDYLDLAIQATYAKSFTDKLALGISVKFLNESIDTESASAVAVDFGSTYQIGWRNLTLGARVNNLGSDIKFFNQNNPLPLNFSFGVSGDLLNKENHRVMLAVDATKPQDTEQLFFTGGEYTFNKMLSVRGGYKFLYSGREDRLNLKTTEEGITLGGGLNVPFSSYRAKVDYAYTDFGALFDTVHKISATFEF